MKGGDKMRSAGKMIVGGEEDDRSSAVLASVETIDSGACDGGEFAAEFKFELVDVLDRG